MTVFSMTGRLGFRVIGTMKLASGLFAVAAGIGIFRLVDHDHGQGLERLVTHLGLDPHNHVIHTILSRLTGIDRMHLRAIEAGTFFYALLHLTEGVGLLLRRDWAGYLVIVATSSLIPFEAWEIVKKLSFVRITLLVLNVAIVCYLIAALQNEHRARAARLHPRSRPM
jgi:uncharacterized membrane protein (DUF2068 family)